LWHSEEVGFQLAVFWAVMPCSDLIGWRWRWRQRDPLKWWCHYMAPQPRRPRLEVALKFSMVAWNHKPTCNFGWQTVNMLNMIHDCRGSLSYIIVCIVMEKWISLKLRLFEHDKLLHSVLYFSRCPWWNQWAMNLKVGDVCYISCRPKYL